jgi:hypothetical protein
MHGFGANLEQPDAFFYVRRSVLIVCALFSRCRWNTTISIIWKVMLGKICIVYCHIILFSDKKQNLMVHRGSWSTCRKNSNIQKRGQEKLVWWFHIWVWKECKREKPFDNEFCNLSISKKYMNFCVYWFLVVNLSNTPPYKYCNH